MPLFRPSKGEVDREDALNQVQAQSYRRSHLSALGFPAEGPSRLLELQFLVDLHHVQADQVSQMGSCPDDVVGLDWRQPSPKLSPCSKGDMGVDGVDIEGDVKGFVSDGVEVVEGLAHDLANAEVGDVVHREALDVALLEVHPLVGVDVADADEHDVLVGDPVGEPLEARDGGGEPGDVGDGVAVVVLVVTLQRVDEVRMGVDPDDLEVLVVAVQGVQSGSADRVVAADSYHHTLGVLLYALHDLVVYLLQKVVEQLQVSEIMCGLFCVLGRLLVVDGAYVAQIDAFNFVLFSQGLEDVCTTNDVGSQFHSLDILPLPNCSSHIKHLLGLRLLHLTDTFHQFYYLPEIISTLPFTLLFQISYSSLLPSPIL